jgi:peroxiredoxin
MRIGLLVAVLLGLFGFAPSAQAEEEMLPLGIGDAAPAWKDLPGVDGKMHSLADLKDKPVIVVMFTCNSCPVSNDYEDRIIAFAKLHADQVAVVAINVNTIPEDRLPQMQERAKLKKYPFPYLYDETQKIGKEYGAVFTPEFFVLNKERKLVFKGGMDDNSSPELVKMNYLEPAVKAALAGQKPAQTEASAIGCRVRYVSDRKRKKN